MRKVFNWFFFENCTVIVKSELCYWVSPVLVFVGVGVLLGDLDVKFVV